jgi:2'-5' RNA ligase
VGAHVTLFHALPGERVDDVRRELALAAGRPPFPVAVTGVRFLGRGVALDLAAPELTALRADVAAAFADDLTPQDRQWRHPHVTVQNKVAPDVARELHDQLSAGFTPWTATARGLGLWHYRGGPWEPDAEFLFR